MSLRPQRVRRALAFLLRQALEGPLRVATPSLLPEAVDQLLASWRFERTLETADADRFGEF